MQDKRWSPNSEKRPADDRTKYYRGIPSANDYGCSFGDRFGFVGHDQLVFRLVKIRLVTPQLVNNQSVILPLSDFQVSNFVTNWSCPGFVREG